MNSLIKIVSPISRVRGQLAQIARYSAAAGSKEHLAELVKEQKVVVFMKGVPEAPRCGFSNAVVQILNFHGVSDYNAHNVLENEDLRQGEVE